MCVVVPDLELPWRSWLAHRLAERSAVCKYGKCRIFHQIEATDDASTFFRRKLIAEYRRRRDDPQEKTMAYDEDILFRLFLQVRKCRKRPLFQIFKILSSVDTK